MFSAGQVCVIDSLCITMIRALDKHTSFACYNSGYKPNSKFTGRDCGYLVLKGYVYIHTGLLCSYCSYCCSSSSFVLPNSHWKFFRRTLMTMRTERPLLPSSGSLKIFFLDSNDYEWEIKWKNILFCWELMVNYAKNLLLKHLVLVICNLIFLSFYDGS